MKTQKRFILFILIFLIILCALSVGAQKLAYYMKDSVIGSSRTFAAVGAEPEDTIDMLVIGDSESYTSMSPMELWNKSGVTSFNCGQPGQRIQETSFLLKEAFKTQSPKVVMLETNVLFRDPGFFTNVTMSVVEPVRYYLPIFRYHNMWKMLIDGKNDADYIAYKGFEIRANSAPYEGSPHYMKETEETEKIPEFVRHYMEDIKKMCRDNGAKLLLVSAPSPVNYNYKKHNAIVKYAKESGLPYIDLNMKTKELGIDWTKDSYDRGDHLNIHGAQKVTAYMSKYLQENYKLPDHRGEDAYKEWDRLYKKYEQHV